MLPVATQWHSASLKTIQRKITHQHISKVLLIGGEKHRAFNFSVCCAGISESEDSLKFMVWHTKMLSVMVYLSHELYKYL